MVYLVVVLVLALVIGPVVWLRPSPAQARQAQLRLRARGLGLEVRIAELPQTRRARVRREDAQQGAAYHLATYGAAALPALSHRSVRDGDAWEESGDELPAALRGVLERVRRQLPADVVAVELGAHGPAVFWRERGGEAALAQIAAQLEALRGAMRS